MAEVAELLMKIGFKDEVTGGLLKVTQQLLAMDAIVERIGTRIGGWKTAIGIVGAALATSAIAAGFEEIAKAGVKVNEQLNMMIGRGVPANTQLEVLAKAMELTQRVPTTTFSENIKHFNEYEYAMGNSQEALEKQEELARIDLALSKLSNRKGQGWALLKMLEETGHLEPGQFEAYANAVGKASIATGGRVIPQQFLMSTKYGRSAALDWDPEFIGGYLPSLIQRLAAGGVGAEGGRTGPGNALMSAYGEVVSGRVGKKSIPYWEKYGLGDPTSDDPETINMLKREVFKHNPNTWVQEVLMPALASHGVDTSDVGATTEAINHLFENRVAGHIMSILGTQGLFAKGPDSKLEQDRELNERAMNASQFSEQLLHHDIGTIMQRFSAGFETLLEVLSQPGMAPDGPVTKVLDSLATHLSAFAKMAQENPEIAKWLEIGLGGVALAFSTIAVGAVMAGFAMFAPGGVALLALIGLAYAMQQLSAVDGSQMGSFATFLTNGSFWEALKEIAGRKDWDMLANAGDAMKRAFLWMQEGIFNGIASGINEFTDALKRLWDQIKSVMKFLTPESLQSPTSFHPSTGQTRVRPIQLAVNLDGHTLGNAMADIIEDLYTHDHQAPTPNKIVAYGGPGGNWGAA